MKKAVITTGGKQYLVSEGQKLEVDLLTDPPKIVHFEPLLVIDGATVKVGTPLVDGFKVNAEVLEAELKTTKVSAIRFEAKKRVRKVRGHRQRQTILKIASID